MNKVEKSYKILESLRLDNKLYLASSSSDYNFVWLRDSFYEVMPYLKSNPRVYTETYHAILDILKSYSWKFDVCKIKKPQYVYEYIHPRYNANGTESHAEWGNCQHDATGSILFGIAQGLDAGLDIMRDKEDADVIQNIIFYLNLCEYWRDPDNGMWEENREIHSSSLGACIAGLKAIKPYFTVSDELIEKGEKALRELLPMETSTRDCDLSQLSLIYPYNLLDRETSWQIIARVERKLLRGRGVARYEGDSYYNSEDIDNRYMDKSHYFGKEAEWTFGLPWLAICHASLDNFEEAEHYIKWSESVMLEDGSMPELYFAGSDKYNGNTPLGWSNSMYLMAKKEFEIKLKQYGSKFVKQ